MTDLADVAAALADRTRARMLEELLGGPPLPAEALAARVGVAPSTVSGHRVRLERAGLVTIEARGRAREARLAGCRPLARACTDWTERRPHLAGALGAALLDAMLDQGWLRRRPDGRALNLTPRGREALEGRRSGGRRGRARLVRRPVGRAE
jgi:DNA-binding transcriptional ArsR family regulator